MAGEGKEIYFKDPSLSCGMQDPFFFFFLLKHAGSHSLTPDQGLNLGCLHWEHRVSAIGREVPIKEFVIEQSPMAVPEQDSFSPSCVLRLPFVCRKTLVKE